MEQKLSKINEDVSKCLPFTLSWWSNLFFTLLWLRSISNLKICSGEQRLAEMKPEMESLKKQVEDGCVELPVFVIIQFFSACTDSCSVFATMAAFHLVWNYLVNAKRKSSKITLNCVRLERRLVLNLWCSQGVQLCGCVIASTSFLVTYWQFSSVTFLITES